MYRAKMWLARHFRQFTLARAQIRLAKHCRPGHDACDRRKLLPAGNPAPRTETVQNVPLVTFYQLFPAAPEPRRADQSLGGSMPARAHSYCEPFRVASGFGWYLYPPINFELLWDGSRVRWRTGAGGEWSV